MSDTPKNLCINLAPSWGEVGNIYRHLAMSGERVALEKAASEAARAFAAAEALYQIQRELPEHLNEKACRIITAELKRQGF